MASAVRQPIDVGKLSSYIDQHVPEIHLPVELKQFGFGQSNPTYQLIGANGANYVLRKKPPGRLLSNTAHRVEREYRIIQALEGTDVPVPRTLCLCEDTSIIGTAFYLMEFLDGRIFEDAALPAVCAEERHEMWHDAIRTLAKLHRLLPSSVGLSSLGKSSGFYNRQIKTFGTIADSQAKAVDVETQVTVGPIPHFDDMVSFFANPQTQPKDRTALVHGDYKIDNLVYHKTEPKVIGILDWEMSTIGHPLSDLSNILSPFIFALRCPPQALATRTNLAFSPSVSTPGLPSRSQCLEWYTQVAGWNPGPDSGWGDAFGVFRNSVIMQGIAARYATRQASSAQAKDYAMQMEPFGEFSWGLVADLQMQMAPPSSKI